MHFQHYLNSIDYEITNISTPEESTTSNSHFLKVSMKCMYSTHPNIYPRREVVLFSVSGIVITLTENDSIRERLFDKIT